MVWIKVDDHFDEHLKFAAAGPLGIALWLAGMAYCNRNLTDGHIPWAVARSLLSWEWLGEPKDDSAPVVRAAYSLVDGRGEVEYEDVTSQYVIDVLVRVGLWENDGYGYLVHDYDQYQPTRAQVEAEREQKRSAGRAGGIAAAQARAAAGAKAPARAEAKQTASSRPSETLAESKPVPVPVPVPRDGEESLSSPPTPPDAADEYYRLKGGQVSQGALSFIDELVRDFGDESVVREMGAEAQRSAMDREFLSRVRSNLLLSERRAEREAEERRRRAEADRLRADEERRASATPEELERQAEMKRAIAEGLAKAAKGMP